MSTGAGRSDGEAEANLAISSGNVESVFLESSRAGKNDRSHRGEASPSLSSRLALPAVSAIALAFIVGMFLRKRLFPLPSFLLVPGGGPYAQSSDYDEWGLPVLTHFEETLPQSLKHEKDALAEAAVEAYTDKYVLPVVPTQLQGLVAAALSGGKTGSLVGLTVGLEDVSPFAPSEEGNLPPRKLQITSMVGFDSGAILVEAQEQDTQRVFTLRIRVVQPQTAAAFPDKASLVQAVTSLDQFDERIAIQACKRDLHNQQPSRLGIALPVYTASITGTQEATLVSECYVFRRVQLLERFQGNIMSLDLQSQIMSRSREYVASRLLQLVLKLQQSGISTTNLDWNTLLVRFDGTFALETFHSSGVFGSALGAFAVLIPHRMEPQLALSYFESTHSGIPVVFQPSSDMWILGTLLYELFTNGELPYNSDKCTSMEQTQQLAEQLLRSHTRSESLRSRLDAAGVPPRWKALILRLLEPDRAHRITSLGIVKEFPDLTRHISNEAGR
ncbi:hypothetical protein, conserved [Eimeria brunetti]|uniref:Protein kinase domain-containing protein n=1 Tax=Eimeria brunetti TaxID=51314 RepID=U6LAC1_9EIME|nr:hypothetical protein, conserved [Eimeria brunetti]